MKQKVVKVNEDCHDNEDPNDVKNNKEKGEFLEHQHLDLKTGKYISGLSKLHHVLQW